MILYIYIFDKHINKINNDKSNSLIENESNFVSEIIENKRKSVSFVKFILKLYPMQPESMQKAL